MCATQSLRRNSKDVEQNQKICSHFLNLEEKVKVFQDLLVKKYCSKVEQYYSHLIVIGVTIAIPLPHRLLSIPFHFKRRFSRSR